MLQQVSKAIMFWSTAGLIEDTGCPVGTDFLAIPQGSLSESSQGCKVCKPMERTESSQTTVPTKSECVHLAFRRGSLSTVVPTGQVLPWPRGTPGYSSPTTQVGATTKGSCHKAMEAHWGRPLDTRVVGPVPANQ